MFAYKRSMNVKENICPDLADLVDFVESSDRRVPEGICSAVCRVRISAQASGIVCDIWSYHVVTEVCAFLFCPSDKTGSDSQDSIYIRSVCD